MHASPTQLPVHPYPLVRTAGPFLLLIGLGIFLATLLGSGLPLRPVFYVGAGLGVTALFALAPRLSFGAPTRGQLWALGASIALEVALFVVLANLEQTYGLRGASFWLWTLVIVGVHFLPQAITFGPLMALLGLLCVLNAAAGLWWGQVPFTVSGIVDGLLKMGFGLVMLRAQPVRPAQ
jgi:hypothetical protein